MATRYTTFTEGEFYHIYNRGVDKRIIYQTTEDYLRFQQLLYIANTNEPINVRDLKKKYDSIFEYKKETELVAIGAYCLMPNHFHILLTPLSDVAVSTFMNKLTTSYSMYFNKRYDRTGRLFEGSFKSKHIDIDEYLKYMFAYIHLNPQKLYGNKQDMFIQTLHYRFSSLYDYLYNNREESNILEPSRFPKYFKNARDHLDELLEWINLD